MLRDHVGNEFIGHINLGAVGVELSVGAHDPVEGQQNGLADVFAFGERFRNPVSDEAVAFGRQFLATRRNRGGRCRTANCSA